MRRSLALIFLGVLVVACTDDEPPVATGSCAEALQPGPAPIRRLTRFEYNNTVRDLLGDTTHPADVFGAEEEALGFNNNAGNLVVSSTLVEKYMMASEGIAERATTPLSKSVACDPVATGETLCAKQFIAGFGRRAFRRPLTIDESGFLLGVYEIGRLEGDFRLGIQMVIQAALQSPPFLYRVELGVPSEQGEDVVQLDDWEMASRLSYFLWGTMPDDELFAAAGLGELRTKEQVEAQARRMLDDPRARDVVSDFHRQWLDYDRIVSVGKDTTLFPDWTPAMRDLMRSETEAFIEHVVFDEEGDLTALLTAPHSFMNAELAAFYGVEGPTGSDFVRVDLDPAQRAGILTTGSLLTVNAHSNQTSPVHRGKLVREQLLCYTMAPPPPDVMITVPEPEPGSTARERFKEHSASTACKGCHQMMDPIGFGFENYDAVGRFRTEEGDQPIDASGDAIESDVGAFDGVVDLAQKLADSEDVQRCYTKQWFRYAYGRGETKEDACSLSALQSVFTQAGGDIRELLVALTQTDAFLYRKAGGAP